MKLTTLRPNERIVLICLTTASVLLKIFLTCKAPVINPDGALYLISAKFISEGDFKRALEFFPYPLFPYLISLVHSIAGNWLLAGRILSLLPSALCVIPLYGIIKRVVGSGAALYGSAAFILAPIFNETSTWIIRDHLALLLGLTGIFWTLASIDSGKTGHYLTALICFLFAAALRIEYAVLIVAWIFAGVTATLHRRRFLVCLALGIAVLQGLVLLGYLSGWEQYLRLQELRNGLRAFLGGEFLENYRSVYRMLTVLGQELPNSIWHPNFSDIARHYIPVIYFLGYLETCVKVVHLPFFLAIFAGLKDLGKCKHKFFLLMFLALCFLPGYGNLLFRNFLSYRYVFPLAALLFVFTGLGFYSIQRRVTGQLDNLSLKKRLTISVVAVIFLLVVVEAVLHAERRIEKTSSLTIDVSGWLNSQAMNQTCLVASDDPRIGWYWSRGDRFVLVGHGSVLRDPAICYFVTDRTVDQDILNKCGLRQLITFGSGIKKIIVYGKRHDNQAF
ncbi:glycosyltransferase family 39 protein [Thermodesulforhabdus norvegica]|uniref:Dolichyl-phosphate-mannose-protein mannosyltransferase n=1 Tax=Thermodesulforhabdus norvegica TaxID=39841 RepID=A0A1I4VQU4_9BACT|nr:glycosyltransferase family 39 protein [Thermodesulforhabdus norvegica]SFN03644.1 Dolichyl-phosphate-mannose-protein mannosyltransferase [Thermodesulforhabdus norvegica]